MKKFLKYATMFAVATAMLPMVSCDDDDTVDPYDINYCYLYQPNSTYAQLEYKANGEFLIDINDPIRLMPARVTKPAPKDLTVEVAIDPALVDEYNKANNSNYKMLEGAELLVSTLHIAKGEYVSPDSIIVSFGDHSGFQCGDPDLILPIAIKYADGMTISKSSRIFLTFTSTYRPNVITIKETTNVAIDVYTPGWETASSNLNITQFLKTEWAADAPITVKAEIDNSLIETYNNLNQTNFQPIQASLVNQTMNIAADGTEANLQVRLGDYTGVANGEEYLVPIKLSIEQGEGAALDKDVAYVIVTELPDVLTGSRYRTSQNSYLDYQSSWSATQNGTDISTILNPSVSSMMALDQDDLICIDLGEAKDLTEFGLYWWMSSYAAKMLLNVETSADGNKWRTWGDVQSAFTGNYAYITFSKKVNARYIRFTVGEGGTWGIYIRKIYFYN